MQTTKTKLERTQSFRKGTFSKARLSKIFFMGIALTALSTYEAKAQFTLTGQLRPRTELRDGQGTLQKKGDDAALFTSQRARLNTGFSGYHFKVFMALQDVRVWGQDASSINRTTTDANDGLMLHEAWGELILNDTVSKIKNLSLKIGRQEIAYDDQKVIGSLDWLQQARRHDAVVLKFANKGWVADIGAAFNQNSEKTVGTVYNGIPAVGTYPAGTNQIGTMYKSFQYAYVGKKFFFGDLSFLFFKDDFNKYTTVAAVKTPVQGVWSRTTTGLFYNVNPTRKINLTGSYYYQGGRNKDGRVLSANLASITSTFQVSRKLFIGTGIDYVSGTDGTKAVTSDSRSNEFDPLYGTPHKFWGYMDYFYVASGFGKQGLLNYFFKAKYNASDKLSLFADLHGFEAANKVSNGTGGTRTAYLGTELDFKMSYNFTKLINIEAGYSYMKATNTMASVQVKNVSNANLSPQWAYVALNIKPDFLASKK
jgi:hypothetical protein